MAGGSICSIY
jgi:serine/threonine protein kinase